MNIIKIDNFQSVISLAQFSLVLLELKCRYLVISSSVKVRAGEPEYCGAGLQSIFTRAILDTLSLSTEVIQNMNTVQIILLTAFIQYKIIKSNEFCHKPKVKRDAL